MVGSPSLTWLSRAPFGFPIPRMGTSDCYEMNNFLNSLKVKAVRGRATGIICACSVDESPDFAVFMVLA